MLWAVSWATSSEDRWEAVLYGWQRWEGCVWFGLVPIALGVVIVCAVVRVAVLYGSAEVLRERYW